MTASNVFDLLRVVFVLAIIHEQESRDGCAADNTTDVQLWPNGIIPFVIPSSYDEIQRARIQVAMERWERKTCVKFVPWSEEIRRQFRGVTRYISFTKSNNCYSRVGLHHRQPQYLGIGDFCMKIGTIVHELGHAIGMIHSIARPDRDYYVTIAYENINSNSRENFEMMTNYDLHGTPYDYKSIMHYGPKAWSFNNEVVIHTARPEYQRLIGQYHDVSFYDAVYVNRAYRCQEKCDRRTMPVCRNGGSVGGTECKCICTDGFVGENCEIPLTGSNHIIDWSCQQGWQFHGGQCMRTFPNIIVSWSGAKYFCEQRKAKIVEFNDSQEASWVGVLMKEDIRLTTARSFWVGVRRTADDSLYKWPDGSRFNDSLMPLHELGSSDEDGCGTSDGRSITISSCDAKQNNGIMCIKDFEQDCGGRIHITSQVSSFVSPRYPNYYPSGITCQYILQTRPGYKIEIGFTDFDIEYSVGCRMDSLEVQLSADILQTGQKYCGAQLRNRTFVSHGKVAYLTFKTNERLHGPGFRVQVRSLRSQIPADSHRTGNGLLEALWTIAESRNEGDQNGHRGNNDAVSSYLDSFWDIFRSMSISNIL